jgi:hypothetical protein
MNDADIATLPLDVYARLVEAAGASRRKQVAVAADPDAIIVQGQRTKHIERTAGSFHRFGLPLEDTIAQALKINATRFGERPASGDWHDGGPLPEAKVRETVVGIYGRYPDGIVAGTVPGSRDEPEDTPRSTTPRSTSLSSDAAVFSLIDLRTMKVRAVEWIEEPFLARGELHILQGHGSAGKGALTCRWHAEASKRKEHTLMVSAEDDMERQIIPRLIAAGADFDYVHPLGVVRSEHEDALEIPGDLPRLEQFIVDNKIQFVSIDPLLTHITGNKDSYKDHEVKRVLTPLSKLAQRTGATVIGVHHFKKDTSGGARHSGQASTAFATTARIVLSMAKSAKRDSIHILEVSKSNIGAEDVGLDLRLEVVEVPAEDGKVAKVPLLHREGEAGEALETVDEALAKSRRGSKSSVARELILDILDDVPHMESDALDARVAQETGVAAKTVQNLRAELGTKGIGLIRTFPSEEYDPRGKQIWHVARTSAPRSGSGDERPPIPTQSRLSLLQRDSG